jgi:hypothetical protein
MVKKIDIAKENLEKYFWDKISVNQKNIGEFLYLEKEGLITDLLSKYNETHKCSRPSFIEAIYLWKRMGLVDTKIVITTKTREMRVVLLKQN